MTNVQHRPSAIVSGPPAASTSAGSGEAANTVAWERSNQELYSILYLVTSARASVLVRKYRGNIEEVRNGQVARAAPKECVCTKVTPRACQKQLVRWTTEAGEYPEDYFSRLDELRV